MTDARAMERGSIARRLAIGLVAIGVVGGFWLAVGSQQDTPEAMGEAQEPPASGQGAADARPRLVPTPEEPITQPADHHIEPADYRIEKGGRLSLSRTSLPADGVVTLGLALDKKALGDGQDPLRAVVVSASDGRRLELSATPVHGPQSSARLEIDSTWLEPGLYMIQIRTAEKIALPLSRYVLEVGR